jgi:hypothetical protein
MGCLPRSYEDELAHLSALSSKTDTPQRETAWLFDFNQADAFAYFHLF